MSPFFSKTKTQNDLLSFQKCHSQVSRKINDFFFRSTLGHDRNLFFLKSGISFFPVISLLKTYKKCADCKRNRKKRPNFFFLLCAPLNFYFLSLMNYCFDLISWSSSYQWRSQQKKPVKKSQIWAATVLHIKRTSPVFRPPRNFCYRRRQSRRRRCASPPGRWL